MSDVIDLDALAPEAITVKIGNEEVRIDPPSLQYVMLLGSLTQKMSKLDTENIDESAQLVQELTEQIYKCAPAMRGKSLNTSQLVKLVTVITQMSVPPDVKELEAKGVSVGDPKAPNA